MLILIGCLVIVSGYSTKYMLLNGVADNVVAVNTETMFQSLGFAIYAFEMPGVMMPII